MNKLKLKFMLAVIKFMQNWYVNAQGFPVISLKDLEKEVEDELYSVD